MVRVVFAHAIQRHVACPEQRVEGDTVRAALDRAFAALSPHARGYVLDEQGALRRNVAVFVDGQAVRDRDGLSDGLRADSEIYVMQALSGG
jgi:hypothetical protein